MTKTTFLPSMTNARTSKSLLKQKTEVYISEDILLVLIPTYIDMNYFLKFSFSSSLFRQCKNPIKNKGQIIKMVSMTIRMALCIFISKES